MIRTSATKKRELTPRRGCTPLRCFLPTCRNSSGFWGPQYGLTLVETLVMLSIFTILMLAVMQTVASFYRFNAYTVAQAYQVDHARRGIEFLVRDIREMTYADDGTFPLAVMEDNRIAFYSDIDRDDSVEYVEYELTGTILEKRIYDAAGMPPTYDETPEETRIISEYVQNLAQATTTFTYFDTDGNPASATSTVTDIKYVETKIIVNIDPVRDPGEYMLRSSAALRNLKDNL
jgi:type II secretory pathway component PulJ